MRGDKRIGNKGEGRQKRGKIEEKEGRGEGR